MNDTQNRDETNKTTFAGATDGTKLMSDIRK